MKRDSLDQSTPFLAFYDLLRIRGIYSTEEKREKLRRGFRRAAALVATFVGVLASSLPQWARGSALGDIFSANAVNGKLPAGTYSGAPGSFMDGTENNRLGVEITGTSSAVFKTDGAWTVDGGSLTYTGGNIFLLAPGGITFNGGSIDAATIVAAAMNSFSFGTEFKPGDVTGSISGTGTSLAGNKVFVGQTVASGLGGIQVGTSGMDADSGITIASATSGGTITFKGTMGDASVLKAGTVEFVDVDAETKSTANGTVDAGSDGTVSGNFTQSGGTVNAFTVGSSGGTVTQTGGRMTATTVASSLSQSGDAAVANVTGSIAALDQTAGTATAGSVTGAATVGGTLTAASVGGKATVSGTLNGVSGLSVGSLEQTGGSIAANGAITINGSATQTGGAITATGTTLASDTAEVSLSQAGNTLGTVSGAAGNVTLNGSNLTVAELNLGTGTLTLQNAATAGAGTITATSVDAGANTLTLTGNAGLSDTSVTAGTVALDAGSSAITLNNLSAGTLQGTAGAVTVANAGAIQLGALTASSLDVTAGGAVSQTGAANVTGTTTVKADGNNVSLAHAGNQMVGTIAVNADAATAGTVTLRNAANTALSLGDVKATTLTLQSNATAGGGTISATSVDAGANTLTLKGNAGLSDTTVTAGTLALDAGTAAVTLNKLSANTLQGTAGEVKVDNSKALSLGALTASSLDVTAGGAVSQTGAANVTGTTTVKADGNNVSLAHAGNQMVGTIAVNADAATAGTVTLRNAAGTALALGDVKATTLTLESDATAGAGTITATSVDAGANTLTLTGNAGLSDTSVTAGTLALDAGSSAITLNSLSANTLQGTAGAVTVNNSGAIQLGALTASSLDVTAGGAITQTGGITVTGSDGASFSGTSITLTRTDNNIGTENGKTLGATATDGDVKIVNNGAIRICGGHNVSGKNVSLEALGDEGYIFLDKRTVDPAHAVVSATDDDNGTITLTSHGAFGQGLPTTGIYQGTGAGVAAKNLVVHAAKDDGTALDVALNRDDDSNVNAFQKVSGNGGAVNLKTSTALDLGALNVASLDAKADGDITQSAATTVSGTATLDAGANKITLSQGLSAANNAAAGKLTLKSNTDVESSVTVSEIDADGKEFKQTGAGTIQVSEDNGIKAALIEQTANAGTIKAKKLDGAVTQNGGTINGTGENGVGNVEITGALDQNAGKINLGTGKLTLDANANAAGDITAGEIDAGTHTFTQDGAGTIRADSITASVVEQTYAGTASTAGAHATINADTINANFTQGDAVDSQKSGAYASASAKTAANGITITGKVVQNQFAANATIGAAGQNVTLQGGATQNGHGKVLANTLTLAGNAPSANVYTLTSTEGNDVSTIAGKAGAVSIYDGTTDGTTALTLQVNVGTDDGNTIEVVKAGKVTLDGATAKSITVTEAGDVEDTGAQADIATTVKLGTGGDNKVAEVTLANTKTLTLDGVESTGAVTAKAETSLALSGDINAADDADLALQGGTFTQNGKAVKGRNVTIDVTGETGTTTIDGNVTAKTGDVLVKSAGALQISGSATTIDASSGSIVAKGKSVEVKEATLKASTADGEGIGLASTGTGADGKVAVSDGAKFVAGTVVVNAGGNVEVGATGDRVTMGKTSGATDATLVVAAGGTVSGRFDAANTPASDVKIFKAAKFDVSAGDTVSLDTLALKTSDTIENFTFTGHNLALESTSGDVNVTVTGGDSGKLAIFNNVPAEEILASVSAQNVVDPAVSPVKVEATLDDSMAAHGLVGNTVNLAVGNDSGIDLTIGKGAIVQARDGGFTLGTDGKLKSLTVEAGETADKNAQLLAKDAVSVTTTGKMDIGGKVESTDAAVALTATKFAEVGTLGSVNAKKDIDVTSTTGNINFYGTATSSEGNVTLTATTPDAAGQTGKSVKVGNGTDAATITATAGKVTLDGGRSVQILSGSTVTAKEFDAKADEYVSIAGTVTATGKATAATDVKAVLTADAAKPAGVQVLAGGKLESTGDAVEITSAGSVDLAGTVSAAKTLDVTANGESTDALKQGISFAGTVSSEGKATLKAENGSIEQTGGSLSSVGLEMKAKDINQSGGSVTATGESSATASAGSVKLGQGGNDFDTLAVTAEQEVNVQDTDELAVSVAGNTTGDVRLQAGAPDEGAGDVSLDVTTAITAGGAVTATAAGNATLEADVQGASVTATANGGALETKAITANNGNAALSGASVTTDGDVTASGANSDATITATGGAATTGGTVTAGRDVSIAATGGANTTAGAVEAGRNATINAGTGEAQVAAVTATAGNAAVIGGAGATVGGNLTAGGNAVIVSDGGAATINAGNTVQASNVGLQGATVANNGTVAQGVNQLAIVQTGGAEMTLTDDTIPTGAQTVGIRSAGNLTVTSDHDLVFGNASVSAGGRTVAANGLASTAGTVEVTVAGNIASSAITGAAGTTVTAQNGGTINVAGNLGQGGVTTINANGATVTAGTLASGGLLDVNNAGAVTANIAAGGDAQIQAASLQAAATQTGGNLTFDNVAGAANVGALAVGGDLNGTVGGLFTTSGGQAGSIGQQGGFNANGGVQQNGALNTGAMTVDTSAYAMNGNLNAGGAAVTINAPGGIQGAGNALQAGTADLNAPGGAVALGALQVGGAATIEAGSYTAVNTAAGSLTFNVGGAANVGTLNVAGAVNGTVGSFTTAGGTVGSIGQNGQLVVNDNFNLNGNLQSGAVNAQAANFVNGGGTLTAGSLTLAGNVGAAGTAFQVNSPNLQSITGGDIYLTDTANGQVQIGTIEATGNQLTLTFNNAGEVVLAQGGTGLSSGGNIHLTVNGAAFGTREQPIPVSLSLNGVLTLDGEAVLLHFILQISAQQAAEYNPGGKEGFALMKDPVTGGWRVLTTPQYERRINRALAFTVDAPELKSKQGVFGDPAFVHTKMNVSEARSMGNMDSLALNDVDFRGTWREILEHADVFELDWKPAVSVLDHPLDAKLKAVKSEVEMQSDVHPFARAGAVTPGGR